MLGDIQKDKWKHFFVGIALGLLLEGVLLHFYPALRGLGSLLVFLFIVVICYGFELASLVFKRGHYDVMDAVAGLVGGVLGMGLVFLAAHFISLAS